MINMKLNNTAFGLASGIIWGLCVFVATIWTMLKGGGHTLVLLEQFYIGYSISWGGAFIGLIWSFVNGFIWGWLFSWLYNCFAKSSEKKEAPTE